MNERSRAKAAARIARRSLTSAVLPELLDWPADLVDWVRSDRPDLSARLDAIQAEAEAAIREGNPRELLNLADTYAEVWREAAAQYAEVPR